MKLFLAFVLLIAAISFVMFAVASFKHLSKVNLDYLKPRFDRQKTLSKILKRKL